MPQPFHVIVEDELPATAERTWAALRELRGAATPTAIADPATHDAAGRTIQTIRLGDAVRLVQRLIVRDDAIRTIRLEMIECEGLDLHSYAVTFQVREADDPTRCIVTIDGGGEALRSAAQAENMARGMYALSLQALADSLRDPASRPRPLA